MIGDYNSNNKKLSKGNHTDDVKLLYLKSDFLEGITPLSTRANMIFDLLSFVAILCVNTACMLTFPPIGVNFKALLRRFLMT
jgi:hypothetical protein